MFRKKCPLPLRSSGPRSSRPHLEELESRITPYAVSGNAWTHPELISLSFAPDGTTWAAWSTVGGISDSAVAAVQCSSGHANIFVVAKDSTLWESHTVNTGGTWTAWAAGNPAGSKWTSDLGAVCNSNTITLWGRGANYASWTWTPIAGA